jgi:hypothetical protein
MVAELRKGIELEKGVKVKMRKKDFGKGDRRKRIRGERGEKREKG